MNKIYPDACSALDGLLRDGLLIASFDTRPPSPENAWHLYSDDTVMRRAVQDIGFVQVGAKLYFLSQDGEVYESNGTPGGTTRVLAPGEGEMGVEISADAAAVYVTTSHVLWRIDAATGATTRREMKTASRMPRARTAASSTRRAAWCAVWWKCWNPMKAASTIPAAVRAAC